MELVWVKLRHCCFGHWLDNGSPLPNPFGSLATATCSNVLCTRVLLAETHRAQWKPLNIRARRVVMETPNCKTWRRLEATGQEPSPHACLRQSECWKGRTLGTTGNANSPHPVTHLPWMHSPLEKGGLILLVRKKNFFLLQIQISLVRKDGSL